MNTKEKIEEKIRQEEKALYVDFKSYYSELGLPVAFIHDVARRLVEKDNLLTQQREEEKEQVLREFANYVDKKEDWEDFEGNKLDIVGRHIDDYLKDTKDE